MVSSEELHLMHDFAPRSENVEELASVDFSVSWRLSLVREIQKAPNASLCYTTSGHHERSAQAKFILVRPGYRNFSEAERESVLVASLVRGGRLCKKTLFCVILFGPRPRPARWPDLL